jgi:hypothetical protein
MADMLKKEIPGVEFNGDAFGQSYTILSVSFRNQKTSIVVQP